MRVCTVQPVPKAVFAVAVSINTARRIILTLRFHRSISQPQTQTTGRHVTALPLQHKVKVKSEYLLKAHSKNVYAQDTVKLRLHDTTCCQTGCQTNCQTGL